MRKKAFLLLMLCLWGVCAEGFGHFLRTSAISLTDGYYYIKCYNTSDSSRYPYLINNDFYSYNTSTRYSLLSQSQVYTNNGVWRIEVDGDQITLLNGQGTGLKTLYNSYTTLNVSESDNSNYPNSYRFSEEIHCTNGGYACGDYHYPINYTEETANNYWQFISVSGVTDSKVYNVVLTGTAEGSGYIMRKSTKEYAYNGGFFISSATLSPSDFTVGTVGDYVGTVTEVKDNTIYVTYTYRGTLFEEFTQAIAEAKRIQALRGVGYPLATSTAYSTLGSAITAAEKVTQSSITYDNVTALDDAVTAYKSTTTDIQMPEDGKAYVFTNLLKSGRRQLLYYDADNARFDLKSTVIAEDIDDSFTYDADAIFQNARIPIASGTADSEETTKEDRPFTNSYDTDDNGNGDTSTFWHSNWSTGSTLPLSISYTFEEASHVDYFVYTPRQDGNENGRFGNITVYYATADAPDTYKEYGSADFNESASASTFTFGDSGLDNVVSVKITINSAGSDSGGDFATCADMSFYKDEVASYFTSSTCEALKSGVTAKQVAQMKSPYLRMLAKKMLTGEYEASKFSAADFTCYETIATVQSRLKTVRTYDPYENPTGIYFTKGDTVVIFASGIDATNYPVKLCIKNFSNATDIASEGQSESSYTLKNGVNVIVPTNRGNGYVNYYNDNYTSAPTVRLHFALANDVGYYDTSKDIDLSEWMGILNKAKAKGADIIDFLTERMHVAVPYANVVLKCPTSPDKLAAIHDAAIYREREIMGLGLSGNTAEPKNHQFARPVESGMYADATGAAAAFGSFNGWCNPDDFDFWSFGHELGHVNQITPGFYWAGCGETTNNIYAVWVEHRLGATSAYGKGYHRLEDEISGVDIYASTRGGRFEAYLEEGVRKGNAWQLQDGPDYHEEEPTTVSVKGANENGATIWTVSTTKRNYDHFVKVIPFWQLELYTIEAEASPQAFADFYQSYRDGINTSTYNTAGKLQIEMMRRFCNAAQIDFMDFFETAGLLKPIKAYIEDYTPGWSVITQTMCDNLRSEIEGKGYPKAPAGLNYINAYNWEIFRDKTALATDVAVGTGCSTSTANRIRVQNSKWPGAVAYKTYDADGNLLHITMYGLGDSQMSSTYTYVLFPSSENPSYVNAVGYDGSEVRVYTK